MNIIVATLQHNVLPHVPSFVESGDWLWTVCLSFSFICLVLGD